MFGETPEHIRVHSALIAASKTATVNPDEQRRWLVAVNQIQIESLFFVLAVFLVLMSRCDALPSPGVSA